MEKRMKVREEEVREYGTKRVREKVRETQRRGGEEKEKEGESDEIMCVFYIVKSYTCQIV